MTPFTLLNHIIPSKTRRKILELFYLRPNEMFYLRKIVREIDEEVNAVKRELDILEDAKVLIRERRLNKVFYTLNHGWIYYDEFLRIYTKSSPLAVLLHERQSVLGKVKFVALSTKYLKKTPLKNDEIHFIAIGTLVVPEVERLIEEAERLYGTEINFTVMTEDEFIFRKKNNDPFLWRFLRYPKVLLIGTEDELMK